ncbi:MAG: flagellar hook-associated protein 3 [Oligoflexia bacterium]|nr:flagellar hook-associated protein 3 [Oligoflexia bacterium]
MTRVSENSSTNVIRHTLNKNKQKMEELQLKGSTLKSMTRPSDNPVSNVEALSLTSRMNDNKQYLRNADYALLNLTETEKAMDQLVEIVNKAKELAISQSSDFYDENIRKNISMEVQQLRNQALAIGNKRVGQRFIFGGFKSLQKPFTNEGVYNGDKGQVTLEISKDFFVPINLNGAEIFYTTAESGSKNPDPLERFPDMRNNNGQKPEEIESGNSRDLASVRDSQISPASEFRTRENIFAQLDQFVSALENNDAPLIRDLLEKFDAGLNRLITMQTKIGSITNTIQKTKVDLESNNIASAERKSNLTDADVTELFSDITRHQNVLKTTYQASQGLMNQTLLDFLK